MIKTTTMASTEKDKEEEKDAKDGEDDEQVLLEEKNDKLKVTNTHQIIEISNVDDNYHAFQTKSLSGKEKVDRWGSCYLRWSDSRRRSHNNYQRFIYTILLIILLAAVLSIIIFVYERMQRSTEVNRLQVRNLESKLDFLKQKLKDLKSSLLEIKDNMEDEPLKESPTFTNSVSHKRGNTIIKLVGDGGLEVSDANSPIHLWKLEIQQGNITFSKGRYIQILSDGYYNINVRMCFKENDKFNRTTLDFGVRKTNDFQFLPTKLVSLSVPRSNCRNICYASISDVFLLKAGDRLSIQTSVSRQSFSMDKDAASFVCHKVM